MQRRQRRTHRAAMLRPHAARPDTGQERRDRGVPPAQMPQRHTVAPMHRQRTHDAALCQVLHQAEKPRQVRRVHALLVQRQDEIATRGAEREIAVLHALRDAAERHHAADVVIGQEFRQRLVGDLGINRHAGQAGDAECLKMRPSRCVLSIHPLARTMPLPTLAGNDHGAARSTRRVRSSRCLHHRRSSHGQCAPHCWPHFCRCWPIAGRRPMSSRRPVRAPPSLDRCGDHRPVPCRSQRLGRHDLTDLVCMAASSDWAAVASPATKRGSLPPQSS